VSELDYFELSQKRASNLSPVPEVQGICINTKSIRQITLADSSISPNNTGINLPALEGKSIKIEYKIERGIQFRVGVLTINASTGYVSFNDDYEESNGDIGVTLSVELSSKDSTAGNETIEVKYTTTTISADATMDYRIIEIV
jgi:hypothetical protein